MTTLLEQAVAKARELTPPEQDSLARLILEEIESEKMWDEAIRHAPEKLKGLSDKAWAEFEAGQTSPLDPDTL